MLLLAIFLCSAVCFALLRYALRHGFWLPIGKGSVHRKREREKGRTESVEENTAHSEGAGHC